MELEGMFKIRRREEGPFDVSCEPNEEAKAPRRSRSFSSYDGMRRYLLDIGVTQDSIPARRTCGLAGQSTSATSRVNRALSRRNQRERDQGLASRTRLNGVCVARRKRVKPPLVTTSRNRASLACAPNAGPLYASEAGTQIIVEAA